MAATVYLGETPLDSEPGQGLAPVIEFAGIELSPGEGASSAKLVRELTLPATPQNLAALNFALSPDADGGAAALPNPNASVRDGSGVLAAGRLEIASIQGGSIRARLIGEDADWLSEIEGLTLQDLDWGVLPYVGAATGGNAVGLGKVAIPELWSLPDGALPVRFALIAYGNFGVPAGLGIISPINGLLPAEDAAGAIEGALLYDGPDIPLSIYAFRPIWQAQALVRAVLRRCGLEAQGPFMSAGYADLYLPYVGDVAPGWGELPEEAWSVAIGEAQAATPKLDLLGQITQAPTYVYVPVGTTDWDTNIRFWTQVPRAGAYRIRIQYRIFASAQIQSTVSVQFIIRAGGGSGATIVSQTQSVAVDTDLVWEHSFTAVAAETYRLEVIANPTQSGSAPGVGLAAISHKLMAGYTDRAPTPITNAIPLPPLAPKIDCKEFLAGLLAQLNMHLEADLATGTAWIGTRQDFADLPDMLTLEYADIRSITPAEQARTVRLVARREDETTLPHAGDADYTVPGPYVRGLREIELAYSPLPTRAYTRPDGSTVNLLTFDEASEIGKRLGDIAAGAEVKYDYVPRLVRWTGTLATLPTPLYVSGGWQLTQIPILEDAGEPSEAMEHHAVWLDKLARGIVLEMDAVINAADLQNLSARRLVRLAGQNYVVSKITYEAGDTTASLRLIKI